MFRVVLIKGIVDTAFNEDSFLVEEAFFFTIKTNTYYNILNLDGEIIGVIPGNYNLFFKVDDHSNFEDIDMANVLRLYKMGIPFQIVGTSNDSAKVNVVSSKNISNFKLIEDDSISIPFTNKAFDSDGIVVFKILEIPGMYKTAFKISNFQEACSINR